ncbi:unnamed protein product, partial [Tetraodon nigroviridis]
MDGWQSYVNSLMADGSCQDCAIVGYSSNKGVWAAHADGALKNITPQEIDALVGEDRQTLCTRGLTLGSQKCSVIRDRFSESSDCTMDIRTKSQGGEPTYNISVGKAGTVLVLVMGKEGVHRGRLNKKAYSMAKYLR